MQSSSNFFTSLSLFLSEYFGNFPARIRPYRYFGIILFLLGTIFFAVGIPRFQLDSSLETWLPKDDPSIKSLKKFKDQFGSDDGVFIVYKAKDGNIFSPSSLKTLMALTKDLENLNLLDPSELGLAENDLEGLNRIIDVQSLANERYEIDDGENLISRYIIPRNIQINERLARKISKVAKGQRNLRLLLFSEEGDFGGIVLKTNFGTVRVAEVQNAETEAIMDKLDEALDNFEMDVDETANLEETIYKPTEPSEYSNFMIPLNSLFQKYSSEFEFYPIGSAPMSDMAFEILEQAGTLVVVGLLLIVLLLFSLFKSSSAVFWTVTCIASCTVWVFGGMAWLEIPSTQLIALTVMLILGIGIPRDSFLP